MLSTPFLFAIFGFDYFVRVADEVACQICGRGMWIKTYPVIGRLVVRVANTIVLGFQFINPFRLTLERNDLKIIQVEETEHMSADIENQHSFPVLKLYERQFLFHIRT